MEYIPRPELDAKLEAFEARMDGRCARIEDAIKTITQYHLSIEAKILSLIITTIAVAVSSVIAILFGVATFNAALLNNMVSSYESGRGVGSSLEQARAQGARTQQLLEQMLQERGKSATPADR